MNEPNSTVLEMVLDAPLVLRVELCAVSLSARQWADVQEGDIVETGVRLGEPVVLRISGQTVGRGELVNVEGEVGVRITERLTPDGTT